MTAKGATSSLKKGRRGFSSVTRTAASLLVAAAMLFCSSAPRQRTSQDGGVQNGRDSRARGPSTSSAACVATMRELACL